jgi:hypothetical protein
MIYVLHKQDMKICVGLGKEAWTDFVQKLDQMNIQVT